MEVLVPTIRKVYLSDAKALAEVAETTFRATFGPMNAAEHMELYCQSNYGERIQAAEISDPGIVTLVAEDGGRIIGYAQMRWDSTPGCVSAKIRARFNVCMLSKTGTARALHRN